MSLITNAFFGDVLWLVFYVYLENRTGRRMMREHAEKLLRIMLGEDTTFRDGQWEAIELVVEQKGRARALLVQRTGWGKSIVYFIATRLLREEGKGITLLISPLLSLMRNQIEMADRIGIRGQR